MPLNVRTKIRRGYIIAFFLMLVSYFLIFFIINRLVQGTKNVSHTYTVINRLELLNSRIVDAETGVRGYVLTKGDERFLVPYNTAIKTIPAINNELKTLTADNESQQKKLAIMNRLMEERLGYLSDGISKYQQAGFVITDEMRSYRERSKVAMDSIRTIIDLLQEHEQELMNARNQKLNGVFNKTNMIAVASLLVAFITILYSLIVYNRENKAKEESNRETKGYREELEAKVIELSQVNSELQELKNIEKFAATGRIARTIAHEVRNPLTNISLAADQLKEMLPGEEPEVLLDMIRRNAARINQLTSDLLQSTRFAQLDFADVDLNRLVDETLEMAKDRIELNHIRVEKQYDDEGCTVSVDSEKMKLALLNIIVNAIEAMERDKGILTVKISRKQDKCLVEIKDNGAGMDPDAIEKIFEPYFTSKMRGNGLGLTNTQNIILNHRGNITVASQPNQGTSFLISLVLN